jgi:carboxyl-terminal processing protease
VKESRSYIFANNKKRKNKRSIIGIVTLLFFTACGSFVGGNYLATKGIFFLKTPAAVINTAKQLNNAEKYSELFIVRDELLKNYYEEVDDNALLEGAIKGMTNALNDPYTIFMNQNEFEKFMKESSGSFNGIGVNIASKDNKITIISTIKDSPADKAGLKENDVIQKVNDVELSGDEMDKAISIIGEAKGSEVRLTVQRAGVDPFDISIVPNNIKINDVSGEMIDSSIGYIRIKTFMNENLTDDFKNEIQDLKGQGAKGIILDLRENPGGLLSEAVGVVSQFVPKDKIVTYTIDKYDKRNDSLSIGGIAEGTPLVVLVNGNSASASEVVTGALRDYGVATIVGSTTFGKGIVQQSMKFNGGFGGLKITVSKYYTPNGENIHKKGITPDVPQTTTVGIEESGYDKNADEQLKMAIEKMREKMQ